MATKKNATANDAKSSKKKPAAVKAAPKVVTAPKADAPAVDAAPATEKKRPGRPPGSGNKTKKAGKKAAGRKPSTEFLYSLRPANDEVDEMGLPKAPSKIEVIGPFGSEDAAVADALASIGTNGGLKVTLYRDFRTGTPEVRTRLI